jgi:hypothetical protein
LTSGIKRKSHIWLFHFASVVMVKQQDGSTKKFFFRKIRAETDSSNRPQQQYDDGGSQEDDRLSAPSGSRGRGKGPLNEHPRSFDTNLTDVPTATQNTLLPFHFFTTIAPDSLNKQVPILRNSIFSRNVCRYSALCMYVCAVHYECMYLCTGVNFMTNTD